MLPQNEIRCLRLIKQAIETFHLDLSGFVVLTEAATNYYMLTPLIAALANADKVYAITKDSRYAKAAGVREAALGLAQRWGVAAQVEVILSKDDPRISDADIITNLGFVRPLDDAFLRRLKTTAVIPLMWETWEFRQEDLDLAECRRLGIPILGTNEHHSDLRTFEYIGHLAIKLLFEAGIEIFRSRIVVIGSGEFAKQTQKALEAVGADVNRWLPRDMRELRSLADYHVFQQADALVVVEHHSRKMLIGGHAELSAEELYSLNPGLAVVHICGGVDRQELDAMGLRCYPDRFALPGHMSVTTDYIGPKPLIDLHAAGLKVGQELARVRAKGLSAPQVESEVLRLAPIAQGFAGYHDRVHL